MGPVNSLSGQDPFIYSLEEWKQGQGAMVQQVIPGMDFIWPVILVEKEGFWMAKPGTDIPLLSTPPPPEISEGVIDQGKGGKSAASPQTMSIIIVHQI